MQWKLSELNLQTVILFQFLDTPGDEVAPRSNKIRKNFENERFRHDRLLSLSAFDSTYLHALKSKVRIGFAPSQVENKDPFGR
jgi:hypothetical protein